MLLTFTTMVSADENQYTMVKDEAGVYVLDTVHGRIKYCFRYIDGFSKVSCTNWTDEEQ